MFAQDPALYADIIFDNQSSVSLLSKFNQQFLKALALVETNNKAEFIEQFLQVGSWFGDYSKQSLIDSKKLLLKADDDRTWSE